MQERAGSGEQRTTVEAVGDKVRRADHRAEAGGVNERGGGALLNFGI